MLFHPSECSGTVKYTFLSMRSRFFQPSRAVCERTLSHEAEAEAGAGKGSRAVELLLKGFSKAALSFGILPLRRSGLWASSSSRAAPGGFGLGLLLFPYKYRYLGLWKRTQRERTTTLGTEALLVPYNCVC